VLEFHPLIHIVKAVADAYYVLSDPDRRKEYDVLYTSNKRSADPSSSSSFFTQFSNLFGGGSGAAGSGTGFAQSNANGQPDAENVFADVFDEVHLSPYQFLIRD
jgi:DnaJ-class molecular chaperone